MLHYLILLSNFHLSIFLCYLIDVLYKLISTIWSTEDRNYSVKWIPPLKYVKRQVLHEFIVMSRRKFKFGGENEGDEGGFLVNGKV
jgi:hypothetical protein